MNSYLRHRLDKGIGKIREEMVVLKNDWIYELEKEWLTSIC